jgi:hypothetical protein
LRATPWAIITKLTSLWRRYGEGHNLAWLRHFAGFKEEYLDHILGEETEQFVEAEKTLAPKTSFICAGYSVAGKRLKRLQLK